LGIELEKGEKVYLQGVSGAAIPAYVHEVDIQLKQFRFKGKIAFSEKLGVGFNIIGRRSIFERFEVCFNDVQGIITFVSLQEV